MKRLVLVLAVALASAVVAYFLVALRRSADMQSLRGSNITWIRTEFGLNDGQFAAVQRLHDDYSGVCAKHCTDVAAARDQLEAIIAANGSPTARAAAEQRVLDLEAVCNDATRAHLHRVAAAMPPAEGERFLRLVEPHLAQLPHDGERLPAP